MEDTYSRERDQERLRDLDSEIETIDRAEEHGTLTLYGIKYRTAIKAEADELRRRLQTH